VNPVVDVNGGDGSRLSLVLLLILLILLLPIRLDRAAACAYPCNGTCGGEKDRGTGALPLPLVFGDANTLNDPPLINDDRPLLVDVARDVMPIPLDDDGPDCGDAKPIPGGRNMNASLVLPTLTVEAALNDEEEPNNADEYNNGVDGAVPVPLVRLCCGLGGRLAPIGNGNGTP
jgi:hypothetical protein